MLTAIAFQSGDAMIVSTALLCLTANLYFEARGEPIIGQYAVAMVTLNRAKNDPARVCREVFKPRQFSWTISGAEKTAQGWKVATPKEDYAWWLAQRIAKQALSGKMSDFTSGATYYHAKSVRPKWTGKMIRTKVVANHLFYVANTQPLLTSL